MWPKTPGPPPVFPRAAPMSPTLRQPEFVLVLRRLRTSLTPSIFRAVLLSSSIWPWSASSPRSATTLSLTLTEIEPLGTSAGRNSSVCFGHRLNVDDPSVSFVRRGRHRRPARHGSRGSRPRVCCRRRSRLAPGAGLRSAAALSSPQPSPQRSVKTFSTTSRAARFARRRRPLRAAASGRPRWAPYRCHFDLDARAVQLNAASCRPAARGGAS